MNTKQEQLHTSFEMNGAATSNSDEQRDMMEIFSNSFNDIYEQSEGVFEQYSNRKSFLLQFM